MNENGKFVCERTGNRSSMFILFDEKKGGTKRYRQNIKKSIIYRIRNPPLPPLQQIPTNINNINKRKDLTVAVTTTLSSEKVIVFSRLNESLMDGFNPWIYSKGKLISVTILFKVKKKMYNIDPILQSQSSI